MGFGISSGPNRSCLMSIEKQILQVGFENFYFNTEEEEFQRVHSLLFRFRNQFNLLFKIKYKVTLKPILVLAGEWYWLS